MSLKPGSLNQRRLAGDKYTSADIASYTWVRTATGGILDIDLRPWPKIVEIHSRPAVQKAKGSSS